MLTDQIATDFVEDCVEDSTKSNSWTRMYSALDLLGPKVDVDALRFRISRNTECNTGGS